MIRMGFSAVDIMVSLLVLGFGFIVMHLAAKSDDSLKRLGKVIGAVMIILGTASVLFDFYVGAVIMKRMMTAGRQPPPQSQMQAAPRMPAPRR